MSKPGKPSYDSYDPVFVHARRETVVIIALFAFFCVWSIVVCYLLGYRDPSEAAAEVSITFGMPTWVFWGLFVPWIAVDVVAVWFCFFFMKNDELGESHEGEDLQEQIEHMHEHEE
ncbi:MAG: DUF997 family protein [Pirellulaceae bacterium]